MGDRTIILAAHFDDAVLCLGQYMIENRGCIVVTIFGGRPAEYPELERRAHDAACGFGPEDDAVAIRRSEDAAAMELVGANGVALAFLDGQYGPSPDAESLAGTLAMVIDSLDPAEVFAPIGIGHADHRILGEAARGLSRRVYEDVSYRAAFADELAERTADLRDPVTIEVDPVAKLPALAAYRSQWWGLRAGAILDALTGPERIWSI